MWVGGEGGERIFTQTRWAGVEVPRIELAVNRGGLLEKKTERGGGRIKYRKMKRKLGFGVGLNEAERNKEHAGTTGSTQNWKRALSTTGKRCST